MDVPISLFQEIYSMDDYTLDRHFEFLGEGASRIVYGIDENYVVKLSKGRSGDSQCKTEYTIYDKAEDKCKKFLCPIVWYKTGMIVMLRAVPFTKILGIKHGNIFEFTNIRRDGSFFKNVKSFSKHFDLLYPDVIAISSWGMLNNKPVLIDYGCTNKLYDQYFD